MLTVVLNDCNAMQVKRKRYIYIIRVDLETKTLIASTLIQSQPNNVSLLPFAHKQTTHDRYSTDLPQVSI